MCFNIHLFLFPNKEWLSQSSRPGKGPLYFGYCILALNRIETTVIMLTLSPPIKKPIKIIIYVYSCNIIFLRMSFQNTTTLCEKNCM